MVVIRLARHGAHKAPFYRIVVADQRKKRDGRIIEQVGTYDPAGDPSIIDLDIAKVDEWISKGAQPSDRVAKIIASVKNEPLPAKLVEQIVENPEAATVTGTDQENGELFIEIEVDEGDIGKIIGRQGRIIKAIRTLARAAASQDGFRVEVELAE